VSCCHFSFYSTKSHSEIRFIAFPSNIIMWVSLGWMPLFQYVTARHYEVCFPAFLSKLKMPSAICSVIRLNVFMLNVLAPFFPFKCGSTRRSNISVVAYTRKFIMLNATCNVIRLNVIMLSVMAPFSPSNMLPKRHSKISVVASSNWMSKIGEVVTSWWWT
jgi:hypothetical protein